jgi:glycosyltransferase involved in cell wall biosynthesis
MTGDPLVSVVVPTYQRAASVQRCVRALERQSLPFHRFEVVVVIDGSTDGTRALLDAYSGPCNLRAIEQPNRGRAAACNTGIRAATGELVVLLDDDMEAFPDCLAEHVAAHKGSIRLGIVGAAPILPQGETGQSADLMRVKFSRHLAKLAAAEFQFGVRDFYTGNFSLPRAIFEEVGGFDETFTRYGNEDLDLFVRLRRVAVELRYAAAAAARQWYEKTFAGLARDSISKGHTSVLLADKHPEVRQDLKLATYSSASPRWRVVRNLLLAGSARWPALPDGLIAAMDRLEHARVPGIRLYYEFLLDYLYWVGVDRARVRAT